MMVSQYLHSFSALPLARSGHHLPPPEIRVCRYRGPNPMPHAPCHPSSQASRPCLLTGQSFAAATASGPMAPPPGTWPLSGVISCQMPVRVLPTGPVLLKTSTPARATTIIPCYHGSGTADEDHHTSPGQPQTVMGLREDVEAAVVDHNPPFPYQSESSTLSKPVIVVLGEWG